MRVNQTEQEATARSNTHDEAAATARALMVLSRESRRATEAAERVDLVVQALAKRWGIRPPEPAT